MPEGLGDSDSSGERRHERRRTYNRRQTDTTVAPPYFEVFIRIATALENIEQLMRDRPVRLPDTRVAHPQDH